MKEKRIPDDLHIIGLIGTYGVLNVQELCRKLNGRDFKWCHSKHEKYKDIDNKMDGQFIKQCNDCVFHYRDVHQIVIRLIKEDRIKSDKRIFFDRKNDNGDRRQKNEKGRRRDHFRFLYLDEKRFKKMILDHTLDGY